MGSTLLSPQEVILTERQLLLDGPPPSSPETPQLPSNTGVVLDTRTTQVKPEVSCCTKFPGLQDEGEGHQAAGDAESSTLVCDASETQCSGTLEPPASFPSPVSSRTRDVGKRQVSGKPDTQESWLPSSRTGMKTSDRKSSVHESSSGIDTSETSPQTPKGLAKDSGIQAKGPEGEPQPKATEVTVCANNSKVSSTGEKVVLWTR